MRKEFDIKFRPQIESGEYKVVTTKGQPVRIICWDRSTTYWKIIALVLAPDGETENPFTYDVNGNESDGCLHNHELDLSIITPEPELSEFEKGYMRIVHKMNPEDFNDEGLKIAKEESAKLLELAKEELQEKVIHDYWKQAADRCVQAREEGRAEALKEIEQDPESSYAFKRGVEYGKEEALKDLPRWKKCSEEVPSACVYNCAKREDSLLYYNGHTLRLIDLERLPGFNE